MKKTDEDELSVFPEVEPIELEITDVLDLHPFPPADVKELVREYLDLAYAKGLRQLRIIHGKGTGAQRRLVRSILEKDRGSSSTAIPRATSAAGALHG